MFRWVWLLVPGPRTNAIARQLQIGREIDRRSTTTTCPDASIVSSHHPLLPSTGLAWPAATPFHLRLDDSRCSWLDRVTLSLLPARSRLRSSIRPARRDTVTVRSQPQSASRLTELLARLASSRPHPRAFRNRHRP